MLLLLPLWLVMYCTLGNSVSAIVVVIFFLPNIHHCFCLCLVYTVAVAVVTSTIVAMIFFAPNITDWGAVCTEIMVTSAEHYELLTYILLNVLRC